MAPPATPPFLVCILAAGEGSRMGDFSSVTQKALLPIRERAILSHIFDRFGPGRDYVIAIGAFAQDLRDYCAMAHPEYRISWVEASPLKGPGSGPGRSLLCCEGLLPGPFFLVCGDTLWSEPIERAEGSDWIGVCAVAEESSVDYCNARVDAGRVVSLHDKERVGPERHRAFIGLAHIQSRGCFFEGLRDGLGRVEAQTRGRELSLAFGLDALIREGLLGSREMTTWTDTGTFEKYRRAARTGGFDFGKPSEFFYRSGDRVIKFFRDEGVVSRLFRRGLALGCLVPEDIRTRGRFLSYRYEPGETFYESASPQRFRDLLSWLDRELWSRPAGKGGSAPFRASCRSFYREKTLRRLRSFHVKYPQASLWDHRVLGQDALPMDRILEAMRWDALETGVPVAFHGDLHFDNVIYEESSGKFSLIDWRPDFGGEEGRGDLYYELAKLRLGIEIDLRRVKMGDFDFRGHGEAAVDFRLPRLEGASEYLAILDAFALKKGLHPSRISLLVGLACVNMAALHYSPYDQMIFHEGRRRLTQELSSLA